MKAALTKHPHFAIFLALAVAMEAALFALSRNATLQVTQYAVIAAATAALAALCVWILTWE